ncbi:MAG: hypothetical protein MJK15_00790 [Colwellia sp.]|nr:hypothetical protein [Colwellia sp.]
MRTFRKSLVVLFSSVLLSAVALASPVDMSHFDVMVPVTITEMMPDSTEMTHADFVATMNFVVDLAVDAPVPIRPMTSALVAVTLKVDNVATMLNSNFERHLS